MAYHIRQAVRTVFLVVLKEVHNQAWCQELPRLHESCSLRCTEMQDQLRDMPLCSLTHPLLFVRGTRDAFSKDAQFESARARLASSRVEVPSAFRYTACMRFSLPRNVVVVHARCCKVLPSIVFTSQQHLQLCSIARWSCISCGI